MATSKQIIKVALLNRQHLTAKQLNYLAQTGDSRKYISELRKAGMPIEDYQLTGSSRTKVYYCNGWALPDKKTGHFTTTGQLD